MTIAFILVLLLNALIGNIIKDYTLVGYHYCKLVGLTKKDKQQAKIYIDTMSISLLQTTYYHIDGICKLFSHDSDSIHALLASKRRLIGLQKVPF